MSTEKKKKKRELILAETPGKDFNKDAYADKFAKHLCDMIDIERKKNGLPPLA